MPTVRVAAIGRARGDLGGRQLGHVHALDLAQAEVHVRQAGTGQHAFGRDAPVLAAQPAQQLDRAFAGGRKTRVTTLGGQHREGAVLGDHAAHAETRAHTDDGADAMIQGHRQALRTDGLEVRAAQRADRMTDGLEIVDDVQVLETLRLAECARGERPGAVGELHVVRLDAAGNRHGGAAQRGGHTRRGAAVMLGGMRDRLVGANRVATHAVHVDRR
jgi:hypothetical protein